MSTSPTKDVPGCKAACGVLVFLPTGLIFFLGGLNLLVIAVPHLWQTLTLGPVTFSDVAGAALLIGVGLIAVLGLGLNSWRRAYVYWKRLFGLA